MRTLKYTQIKESHSVIDIDGSIPCSLFVAFLVLMFAQTVNLSPGLISNRNSSVCVTCGTSAGRVSAKPSEP